MLEVIARLVEQHIADAAAEHDAERRPDQEIVDVAAPHQARRPVRQRQADSASRSADRRYRPAHTSGSQTARSRSRPGRSRETEWREAASALIVRPARAASESSPAAAVIGSGDSGAKHRRLGNTVAAPRRNARRGAALWLRPQPGEAAAYWRRSAARGSQAARCRRNREDLPAGQRRHSWAAAARSKARSSRQWRHRLRRRPRRRPPG